jgi:hypothetical protein
MATSDTLAALTLVVQSSTGSKLQKDLICKRLAKAHKQGRLAEHIDNPEWMFRLCCAKLMLGNFSWQGWEHRHPWAQMLWFRPDALGIPRWDGRTLKRLLVLGEQGLGDEVMFGSCIPEAQKRAEVVMITESRMQSVFERCFGIQTHPRDIGHELTLAKELAKDCDAYIGVADLPRVLGMPDGRSFLSPDPSRLAEMGIYRGKVGVSWRGRNGQYPLKDFPKGLSLQYDINWDEEVEAPHIDLRNDIEGVIALLSVLSKVITVSTSVAHFAGALGVETEVIQAPVGSGSADNQINWRWGQRKKVAWYRSVKVYSNLSEWRAENRIR